MHRLAPVFLAALLLVVAASESLAADVASPPARTTAPAPAVTTPVSTPSLTPAEEQMISRYDRDLVPFQLPGGGVGLDLQGRFQEFATISLAPGGKLVFRCVDDASVLRRILFGPAETAPAAQLWEDR